MEALLSSHTLSSLLKLNPKPSSPKPHLSSFSLQPRPTSVSLSKPITCSLEKHTHQSLDPSLPIPRSWFTIAQHGLAALALSLALNFSPLLYTGKALASEFDVLNEGPPKDSYLVDDAGVLSRVTKSDLKRLLSDLESRKNFHINIITVRKLTSKADAFEYADQVLERWYPSVEEGNNKGIVVLVTSQKEGAVTGGPAFIQAVGENILDATVSENLPVLATDEKYNEAVYSSAKRLVAAIDGLPDPGGPTIKDNKKESNFKTREETEEKRGQFSLVVGGLLVVAFVVPMAQYYAYVSKK
ncbi:Repair_PSII domain-containing protein [Cephalotus follicularis]|uniref:Repair_PSII domain-containing protein n=1 Tax=Cephalotus follicularis TaxID=3775 RepID=A0A1Q3B5K7_CEPFO|nr:Repair_PSII domain-containing protein [Cephalotus follicularis]